MENRIDIPVCSPLAFVKTTREKVYNTPWYAEFLYPETVHKYEDIVNYLQPWQTSDPIPIVFLSNFDAHTIQVIDKNFQTVYSAAVPSISSSIEITGQKQFELIIPAGTIPIGVHKFLLLSNGAIQETDWMCFKEFHDYTVLMNYRHSENDYGVAFETGISFNLRVQGFVGNFQPGNDRVVYIDQRRKPKLLSASKFNEYTHFIGTGVGVPDYIADIVNNAYLCDTLQIDGKYFVGSEGAQMEAERPEFGYPLVGWGYQIREQQDTYYRRFIVPESDVISTVVTNIETPPAFGTITTGGAQGNQFQLISND